MSISRLNLISEVKRGRLRTDSVTLRIIGGSLERTDALLEPGEKRADLFREAIERELQRRQKKRDSELNRPVQPRRHAATNR